MGLNQQCSTQLMGRHQELQSLKLVLERQANDLHLDYEQRKATEEILTAQYDAHQKAYQMHAQPAGRAGQTQKDSNGSVLTLGGPGSRTPPMTEFPGTSGSRTSVISGPP